MVMEEMFSIVDTGNNHNVSQAEAVKTKPKRLCSAKKKLKKKVKKHRKAYEKRLGKMVVKLRPDKPKEKKRCHYYDRGRCGKGLSCPFSHDFTPITKSEVCKYLINHCCLKGDDCPYSHALSTFPCKHFHIRGKCMDADSCRFSHEPISEEAKQKLLEKIEQERQAREGNYAMDRSSFERIHPKHPVLPSDLELFPLGCKHGKRTPLKFTDAAASKILCLDKTGTGSMSNNIREIPMLVEAKTTASTFVGGETGVSTANSGVNKSMLHSSLLDPTGFLADKSSATHTTNCVASETRLPLVQTKGFSKDATMTQERKTKVNLFLQEQLNTSHSITKSKLGMGSERTGGCFALLNQPRAMSMGQTSLLKVPNTHEPRDRNAKGMMGSLHASVDHSHLAPTFKPLVCAGHKPRSNFSVDQGSVFSESVGMKSSAPNPSVLGPSLLDLVSAPQRAMFPKGTMASTSGLLSPTVNTTSKRSTACAFLDRFLKA